MLKNGFFLTGAAAAVLTVSLAAQTATTPKPAVKPVVAHPSTATTMLPAEQTALVKTYCATCHTDRTKDRTGGLSFQNFDAAKLEDNGEMTERMIRKLRAGMMPPPGAKRPEPAVLQTLLTSFESRMDKHAALNPNPGSRPFQRYIMYRQNKILKDMLAIDVVRGLIPKDHADTAVSAFRSSGWLIGGLFSGKFLARSRYLRAIGKLGLSYWHIQRATAAQGEGGSFQQNPILREEVLKWRDEV